MDHYPILTLTWQYLLQYLQSLSRDLSPGTFRLDRSLGSFAWILRLDLICLIATGKEVAEEKGSSHGARGAAAGGHGLRSHHAPDGACRKPRNIAAFRDRILLWRQQLQVAGASLQLL